MLQPSDPRGSNIRAALRALGGKTARSNLYFVHHKRLQVVVGALNLATKADARAGEYNIVVIDNRSGQLVQTVWPIASGAPGWRAFPGWSGQLDEIVERYPWLRPVWPIQVGGGSSQEPVMSTGFGASRPGLLPFYAVLPTVEPVTSLHRDLTVGAVITREGVSDSWAIRLN